eukprot:CAMPEP_0198304958 /NCGR_PEP_ID=MMETSP1449-20131203/57663_1 /TAXON_ID=420275 /ORGANISM="Attheya septentrionalis, Strain CCMP2084" /LENGTH=591 /DNA_ID=CAMNT_0044007487 /DNA_START=561 /DNA_END=2336 /DNA_ORIENTATION=-
MVINSRRSSAGVAGERPKDQTRLRIEKMEAEREERRRAMVERKKERAEEEQRNIAAGNPGDVDFIGLVREWRKAHMDQAETHESNREQPKICICVRKRPVNDKERQKLDHDAVTCLHPTVTVHSCKVKVDGISKYLDHSSFRFDHAFDDHATTEEVYTHSTMPLIDFVCSGKGVRATVFAYGQTGSGKTHTMGGIQSMVAEDLFLLLNEHGVEGGCTLDDTNVSVAFFEIYGGRIQDLLNNRFRLKLLEDGKGEVVITGLEERSANDAAEFLRLIEEGNRERTTHATEKNDTSSRSHAICQIMLRAKGTNKLKGKLSLVDLAGSERGSDTKSHNQQRRTESSDINTSLLALKECIRALDSGKGGKHVPYRASKLTLILKDCFTSELAQTSMIATVSPGASSADHTINTLRYADRIKEQKVGDMSNARSKSQKSTPSREPPRKSMSSPATLRSPARSPRRPAGGRDVGDIDPLEREESTASKSDIDGDSDPAAELERTVQRLFQEEENLLNLHMSIIQENAELLTEEGQLLQTVQGEGVGDYEIDEYASRLGRILDRKSHLIASLQEKIASFRVQLKREGELSREFGNLSTM